LNHPFGLLVSSLDGLHNVCPRKFELLLVKGCESGHPMSDGLARRK
jgi:hypothetical protein